MIAIVENERELVVLDRAFRRLAEASSLDEVKHIRDKAEAVRSYAQNARLGLELQNRAAELKLGAERKAGKLLSGLQLRGGDRRSNGHRDRLKLDDLGISHNQSKRWQREATIPEREFQTFVKQAQADGAEISSASLLRLARKLNTRPKSSSGANGVSTNGRAHVERRAGGCASEMRETIGELRGHRNAIENILNPECSNGQDSSTNPKSSRLLRRYLTEMAALIDHLEELLP